MRAPHVLITGGSRGIGLAIAQLFAKNRYRCTLISRSEKGLVDAIATLETSSSQRHAYIAANISDPSFWTLSNDPSTSSASPHSSGSLGLCLPKPPRQDLNHPSRIDVLVNCAGISQASLFTRTPPSEVESILALNLTSVMLGTRFLLRNGYLGTRTTQPASPQDSGELADGSDFTTRLPSPSVINISSALGLHGGYGAVAYATTKAALIGFTRALAGEYASHRVRVNALAPGYIATDMTKDFDEAQHAQRIPLARFGTPQEVAHAALFLAQNQYAHNCVIGLDGGLSAV